MIRYFALACLFEHDLFRKPPSTFRDHALAAASRVRSGQAHERLAHADRSAVADIVAQSEPVR
ncbi:MAG: hypothetical protein WBX95_00510, partial [Xanthobacteraceae bacterium]